MKEREGRGIKDREQEKEGAGKGGGRRPMGEKSGRKSERVESLEAFQFLHFRRLNYISCNCGDTR